MKLSSRKASHGKTIELNMTSMIDVVFLLLIFFMVTASFVKTERNLDSAIKVNRRSAAQTQSDLQPAIVDIVAGGGGYVYKIGGLELATVDELLDVLRRFENKVDGAFVRATDDAPFRMTAEAIQVCRVAGFSLVSYVPLSDNN